MLSFLATIRYILTDCVGAIKCALILRFSSAIYFFSNCFKVGTIQPYQSVCHLKWET